MSARIAIPRTTATGRGETRETAARGRVVTLASGERVVLWFAAALDASLAIEAFFAPGLFAAPIYAPLAPHLGAFAALSALAAAAALAASEAPLPARARTLLVALTPLAPLVVAANFAAVGRPNGLATWSLLAVALLAVAWATAVERPLDRRYLRISAAAIVLLQGILMVVNPGGFLPSNYGSFNELLWLWGPTFIVCGAVYLVAEARSGGRRGTAAWVVPAALCLLVLTITFLGTGLWTGVTIYGLLFVFLGSDRPRGEPARVPVFLILGASVLAIFHAGESALALASGTAAMRGLETNDLLRDIGMVAVSCALLGRTARRSPYLPRLSAMLAAAAAITGTVGALLASDLSNVMARGGLHAVGGDIAASLMIVAFGIAAALGPSGRDRAWMPVALVSVGGIGLSLGLDGVMGAMLNLATPPRPVLAGGPDAFDSLTLVLLSLAVGIIGMQSALDAPIAPRVFTAFAGVLVVALAPSAISDASVADLLALPSGSAEVAAVAARLGATRGVLLLVVVGATVLSALLLTQTLARPLLAMTTTLRRYAGGDHSARFDAAWADEFGLFARTFNEFAAEQEEAEGRQRKLAATVAEEHDRLRRIIDGAFEAFVGVDRDGRIVEWSRRAEELFGWPRAEVIGRLVAETVMPPGLREDFDRSLRLLREGEQAVLTGKARRSHAVRRDGYAFAVEVSVTPIGSGQELTFGVFVRDISEQERREAELERLALYDPLSGLANRTLLADRWRVAAAARREATRPVLILVDLDDFGEVNEAFGHLAGDRVLNDVAQRIRGELGASDAVGRLYGDEFAVILEGVSQPHARGIADQLLVSLARPISVEGRSIAVTASVAIAAGEPDEEFADALRRADLAMDEAKSAGGNRVVVYATTIRSASVERITLTADLGAALAGQGLRLLYQPVVEASSGRVREVEALLRWDHPLRGAIPPSEAIAAADRAGLTSALGDWVAERALADLEGWWAAAGHPGVGVRINASARQLDASFVDRLLSRLTERGVPPGAVTIELTEDVLVQGIGVVRDALVSLRAAGVRVSVDDFGTGYSSIRYLEQLPIDEVKLDGSLVAGAAGEPRKLAVVRATHDVARSLDIAFVAEGIEDVRTWDVLAAFGPEVRIQGFGIARPMPAGDLEGWIAVHARRVATRSEAQRATALQRSLRAEARLRAVAGSTPPLDDLLTNLWYEMRGLIPYDRIGVALLEDGGRVLRARWAKAEYSDSLRLARGYTALLSGSSLASVISTGTPRIISDLDEYLARKPESLSTRLMVDEGVRSSLTVPLVAADRALGVMFFSSRTPHAYDHTHSDAFMRVASAVSDSIARAEGSGAAVSEAG